MENLTHTTKFGPGNNWTEHTLGDYNIQVIEQSFVEFFDRDQLPPVPPAARHFCETANEALALDDDTIMLLRYLDFIKHADTAADHFMARLLKILGYTPGHQATILGYGYPLDTPGTQSSVFIDFCMRNSIDNILVVKRARELEDPESQLIAGAIGAYQQNNFLRKRKPNITTLDEMILPGITLLGTSPTFYKIRVTSELNYSVIKGVRPANTVVVYRHTPRLPCPNGEGIKSLENRTTIVQYYEAFKAFVQLW